MKDEAKNYLETPKRPAYRSKYIPTDSPILKLLLLSNELVAVVFCRESTVQIWNVDENKIVSTLDAHDQQVSALLRLSSSQLISGSHNEIILWDISKKERPIAVLNSKAHGDFVQSFCSINENSFASSSRGSVIIWDTKSLSPTMSLNVKFIHSYVASLLYEKNTLIAAVDNNIAIWDMKNIEQNSNPTYLPSSESIKDMTIFKDNVLVGASYKHIALWDIEKKAFIAKLTGHQGWVRNVINFKNKFLISSSDDHTIRFWNVDTRRCFYTMTYHTNAVFGLGLNEHRLISGSSDHAMMVWELSEKYIESKSYEQISNNKYGLYSPLPLSLQADSKYCKKDKTSDAKRQSEMCLIL